MSRERSINLTVDSDVDSLGDRASNPVLSGAGVGPFRGLVQRRDEEGPVREVVEADAAREHLVVQDTEV